MKEPKIRFKGFRGEWEETPFSEIVNRTSASASSSLYPGVEFEDINSGEGTLNKDVRRKKIVKTGTQFSKGDVLFGKLRPYLKNILLADFKGVAIGDFWVLKPQKVTSELLYILLNSREFMRIANISSGSKMPRADWNLVSYSPFTFPNAKEEQLSLGAYFQHLDSLIQSTTKKIESLKQVKAASLQSMFPQEGETTPRVRFKGFEGEWEKVSIKECLEEINEKNFPIQTNFVLSLTIKDGVLPYSEKGNIGNRAKEDHSLYKLAYPNTIVLNSMNILIGAIGVCNYFGCVSPVYYVLKETEQADLWFMYYIMSDRKFQIELNQIATGMMEIRKKVPMDELMEKAILVPNKEEQHKIADYFTSLDRQITLYTQRLEKLKQIKSACLDNMFV